MLVLSSILWMDICEIGVCLIGLKDQLENEDLKLSEDSGTRWKVFKERVLRCKQKVSNTQTYRKIPDLCVCTV